MARDGTRCPDCSTAIPEADINIREGVALCRSCDTLWKLRELAAGVAGTGEGEGDASEEAASDRAAGEAVPGGCYLRDLGVETVMGATCRGGTGCFFLVFATIWNSIVSVFVCIAAAGLYTRLVGPLPAWFPMAGTTVRSGGAKATVGAMPLGMTVFLCIFLIPFVLIGLGTACMAVLGLLGRVELRLKGSEGSAFTGVGPVGWTRRFSADLVTSVRVTDSGSTTNNKPNKHIVIESDKTVKLGVMLSDRRRRWLAGVLRRVLMPKG